MMDLVPSFLPTDTTVLGEQFGISSKDDSYLPDPRIAKIGHAITMCIV